jgi:hypothetical protein
LTSITIPSGVSKISDWTFSNCTNLTNIIIPSSVTSIGRAAFEHCSGMTSFTIPSSVKSIGSEAFSYCTGLTDFTIPSGVTAIDINTFWYCSKLKSVTIHSGVTKIGSYAFYTCSSLASIYLYSSKPIDISQSAYVFETVNTTTCVLYVPTGLKSAYQAALKWKDFMNIVEVTTATPKVNNDLISVFPNPVTDFLLIKGMDGISELKLTDLNGKLVLQKKVSSNEKVSVSELTAGTYLINISYNGVNYKRKVVKN